jgi:hypothetical protein
MKLLPIIILLLIFNSCKWEKQESKNAESQKKTQLTTKSIYGDWTIQEIIDSLYSDPSTADSFYLNRITILANKIKTDGNDSLTLFPECPFDKVVGKDAYGIWEHTEQTTIYGSEIELNESQVKRLMRIINNPLNFSWTECGTWTPSSQFDFYFEGKFVRSLEIGCSWQLKTDYEKVKFGTLKTGKDFRGLCNDIGLRNE